MKFIDVIGLEGVKKQLIHSVLSERISHAIMLLGTEGRGGLPLALAFAQYLNCSDRSEEDSCGNCPSCRKMLKYIHPDVHFSYPVIKKESSKQPPISTDYITEWREAILDNPYMTYIEWMQKIDAENKQGNITIQECHSIIRELSLKAFDAPCKVLIMWLPEYLGKNGNSLLKVIEEPPPDTFFIFICQNKDMVLNTILSRTQLISLPPLSKEQVSLAIKSKYDVDEENAGNIAILADGNFSEAIRLCRSDQSSHYEKFRYWIDLCGHNEMVKIFKWCEEQAGSGREYMKDYLRFCLRMAREALLFKSELNGISTLNPEEKEFIQEFNKTIQTQQLQNLYDLFSKSHYYIERNASPKIIFFNLSLQLNSLLSKNR